MQHPGHSLTNDFLTGLEITVPQHIEGLRKKFENLALKLGTLCVLKQALLIEAVSVEKATDLVLAVDGIQKLKFVESLLCKSWVFAL